MVSSKGHCQKDVLIGCHGSEFNPSTKTHADAQLPGSEVIRMKHRQAGLSHKVSHHVVLSPNGCQLGCWWIHAHGGTDFKGNWAEAPAFSRCPPFQCAWSNFHFSKTSVLGFSTSELWQLLILGVSKQAKNWGKENDHNEIKSTLLEIWVANDTNTGGCV